MGKRGTVYVFGLVLLAAFGGLCCPALFPWLCWCLCRAGLGRLLPDLVTHLARWPWLVAASASGFVCFLAGRVLNTLLNPIMASAAMTN
jgi:hypothetical protein